MPTGPYKPILDPDFAIVGAQAVIERTAPLLRELANHASQALQRCQSCTNQLGGPDEDIAPFALYRLMIELTDSAEVLVRNSCGLACIPLTRTAFETSLALQYIFDGGTPVRSLSWLCLYMLNRLRSFRLLDASDPSGVAFASAVARELGGTPASLPDPAVSIANAESFLQAPHMLPVFQEYQKTKRSLGTRPAWYELFGGPQRLRGLAAYLRHEAEYDLLYRHWSSVSHAQDLSAFLTSGKSGNPSYRSVRYPGDLAVLTQHVAIFQLRATRLMVNRYRRGESLRSWYLDEVQSKLLALGSTTFDWNIIES